MQIETVHVLTGLPHISTDLFALRAYIVHSSENLGMHTSIVQCECIDSSLDHLSGQKQPAARRNAFRTSRSKAVYLLLNHLKPTFSPAYS